jgi:hypothetical protein
VKNFKPIGVLGVVLLIAAATFLSSHFPAEKKVDLPGDISTVAGGYPFALRVKDRTAKGAQLTTVFIDFDRAGPEFKVPEINYGFQLADGRVLGIVTDNSMRAAYLLVDASDAPYKAHVPSWASTPIDLSIIKGDVPEVMMLAKTNGLDEFCALTTEEEGTVSLTLANSESGPVWTVGGDGWSNGVPVAELSITIDARTGAVRNHSLERAAKK